MLPLRPPNQRERTIVRVRLQTGLLVSAAGDTRMPDGMNEGPGDGSGAIACAGGNRAGIVEWANDAFAQLTGIPLAETVDKPVTRFLDRAGLSVEVVDFVAQHFFEGRSCRIELPFDRPDGRRIEVLLEVESLRDLNGEIDRFVARALERPAASIDPPAPGSRSAGRSQERIASQTGPTARSDLSRAVRDVLFGPAASCDPNHDEPRRLPNGLDSPGLSIDLALASDLAPVAARPEEIEALVAALLSAARLTLAEAGSAQAMLSITTDRLRQARRFVSPVYPLPAPLPDWAAPGDLVLEIHDTGWTREARPSDSPRDRALARADACARRLGAYLRVGGMPGCGHQALVVFPMAD